MVFASPYPDIAALIWFIICWFGYGVFSDRKGGSLLKVMNEYRLNWMRQMLARENRIMDITLIGNLLRSISFFASTSIFILLGLFTLLKYHDEAAGILTAIPYASTSTPFWWESKIFLLVVIFVYSFFKYTWSVRQYNYVCILVGAAPAAGVRTAHSEEYAQNGARLASNAARHFNLGLRGYYFGLAAISWFINPWAFIVTSAWVVWVIYRREFLSHTLSYMVNPMVFKESAEQ